MRTPGKDAVLAKLSLMTWNWNFGIINMKKQPVSWIFRIWMLSTSSKLNHVYWVSIMETLTNHYYLLKIWGFFWLTVNCIHAMKWRHFWTFGNNFAHCDENLFAIKWKTKCAVVKQRSALYSCKSHLYEILH